MHSYISLAISLLSVLLALAAPVTTAISATVPKGPVIDHFADPGIMQTDCCHLSSD